MKKIKLLTIGNVLCLEDIRWEDDWDTLVIGHVSNLLNRISSSYFEHIIKKCYENNKKICFFDDCLVNIANKYEGLDYFVPMINKNQIPLYLKGKMFGIRVPTVAVIGTKARQGKFSVEIQIVNNIKKMGYSPAFLSTEPSGYVAMADYVFPYGYGSTLSNLTEEELSISFNNVGHAIVANNDKDILIYGLQSGMIPRNEGNIGQMTAKQACLLFGIVPDAFILCVSVDDTIDYIVRTKKYVEALCDSACLGILLSPVTQNVMENGMVSDVVVEEAMLECKLHIISENLSGNVFRMNAEGIKLITESTIDYFVNQGGSDNG